MKTSRHLSLHKFFLSLSLILGLSLAACQKAPINGNLDGQWEVMDVYPFPGHASMGQRFFYNFSLQVVALTYYGEIFMNGNMRYDGDTLWLDFPFAETEKDDSALRQFGIFSNPVTFNVEFQDSHHLTLSNDESTVVLVKH